MDVDGVMYFAVGWSAGSNYVDDFSIAHEMTLSTFVHFPHCAIVFPVESYCQGGDNTAHLLLLYHLNHSKAVDHGLHNLVEIVHSIAYCSSRGAFHSTACSVGHMNSPDLDGSVDVKLSEIAFAGCSIAHCLVHMIVAGLVSHMNLLGCASDFDHIADGIEIGLDWYTLTDIDAESPKCYHNHYCPFL